MLYAVELTTTAARELQRVPQPDRRRIQNRIDALADDPRPAGATKLVGIDNAWRVRQGNYRVVYEITDAIRVVTVTRIAQRGSVYR